MSKILISESPTAKWVSRNGIRMFNGDLYLSPHANIYEVQRGTTNEILLYYTQGHIIAMGNYDDVEYKKFAAQPASTWIKILDYHQVEFDWNLNLDKYGGRLIVVRDFQTFRFNSPMACESLERAFGRHVGLRSSLLHIAYEDEELKDFYRYYIGGNEARTQTHLYVYRYCDTDQLLEFTIKVYIPVSESAFYHRDQNHVKFRISSPTKDGYAYGLYHAQQMFISWKNDYEHLLHSSAEYSDISTSMRLMRMYQELTDKTQQ